MAEQNHADELDALRGIGVVLVMHGHYCMPESLIGRLAVRLFFALSAFLITDILLRARESAAPMGFLLRSFWMRRVLRILPAYYLALAFCATLSWPRWPDGLGWSIALAPNIWFALSNSWEPGDFSAYWTIGVEEQFYLMWPLLLLFTPRRMAVLCCVGLIASAIAFYAFAPFDLLNQVGRWTLPPASWDAMGVGALMAASPMARGAMAKHGAAPSLIVLVALAAGFTPPLFSGAAQARFEHVYWAMAPLLPLTYLLAVCAGGRRWLLSPILRFKPFIAMGIVSYGVYLLHLPMRSFMERVWPAAPFESDHMPPALAALLMTITFAAATLMWFAWEKPFNSLKRFWPYTPRSR